jgi:LacI family transcriptional regulator
MNDAPRPNKPAGRTPTIRDVALRAGVSPATVSSVLTGIRPVAEGSRRLVLEAIDTLGFKANHMASSLRMGRSRTVGVVVPDLANEFFASLVRHYEENASRSGYEILVVASGEDPRTESSRIESLIARRVDGLLVVVARDDFGTTPGFPANLPPTVLVDRGFGHPGFDTVASDNFEAGRIGCEHLLRLGHADIALLIPGFDNVNIRDRVAGYRRALDDAGLGGSDRVVAGGRNIDVCRAAIEQELRRADPPTAIFATTYFATVGAIKAIQAVDLAFPGEVSLLGFEHAEWMTAIRPYVSAISQSFDRMATDSWRLLQQRIAGNSDDPVRISLPCVLNVRESANAPRAGKRLARSLAK